MNNSKPTTIPAGMRNHQSGTPRILIVDDSDEMRHLLSAAIRRRGFECHAERTIADGIHRSNANDYAVVVLDFRLEDGNAFRLLDSVPELSERSVVILISGTADMQVAVDAMRRGVRDFLNKPFTLEEFSERLDIALERWRARVATLDYQSELEEIASAGSGRLELDGEEAERVYDETVLALGAALNLRDADTEEHCRRVMENATILARRCAYPDDALRPFRWGAYLHDIGKIGVPDRILLKPAALTESEMEIVKMHPLLGYRMVSNIGFLRRSASVILSHHERFDGTGYPFGIRGNEIPLTARIFAVIDTMDAILFDRPYRAAMTYADVVREIERESGSHYDPWVVDRFLTIPSDAWWIEPPKTTSLATEDT